jgi:arginyl-tRNA synthetase
MSTSTAPPVVSSCPSVNPKYALPDLPHLAGVDIARSPLDAFRLAVAKLVSEAWGDVEVEKIFAGVDTGESIWTLLRWRRRQWLIQGGKKGADLAVAIPRFKKGKPDEWGKRVVDAVSKENMSFVMY